MNELSNELSNVYAADFETTNFKGQEFTEVWLAGLVSLDLKQKVIFTDIDAFMKCCFLLPNPVIFFHNLKFDGSFILDWLERNGFKKSLKKIGKEKKEVRFNPTGEIYSKEYTAYISARGMWYNIVVKKGRTIVTFRDSLKLLPFSLDAITKAFNVKHKKLTMVYDKYRESDGIVTPEEMKYFEHDLYGLAECLAEMFNRGFTNYTIGSCCLKYFRELYGKFEFSVDFPDVYSIMMDESSYDSKNVGDYIMKSYYGGFVYVNPMYQEKIIRDGMTLDATSLYAGLMHSKSNVYYPIGNPIIGNGCYRSCDKYKPSGMYFFQRFRCQFKIKPGKLPFVKIRNSYLYDSRTCLSSSDIILGGRHIPNTVELCYTMSEFKLFLEHYDVWDLEFLDYVGFYAVKGLFDEYINYWLDKKNNSKNDVERTIAKLMLVNLYGKFCAKTRSDFKIPYYNEEKDCISFHEQEANDNIGGYIPIGSAIVSESRVWHIRNCQQCHAEGKFVYSDTDSCHIIGLPPKGFPISKNQLLTYKIESKWDVGWYQHGKRYIDGKLDDDGKMHYEITAAGLPQRGKDLLRYSMGDGELKDLGILTEAEQEFIKTKRKLQDFTTGIRIPGKKRLKRMKGGVVLKETSFTIL